MSDSQHERSTGSSTSTVVVFTGGDPVRRELDALVPKDAYVIAADSGLHAALALGRHADLVIGDLDSASSDALAAASAAGSQVERHPVAKDHTDLELALDRAAERAPARVIVLGGYGGRLDHFLANALVLASERYRNLEVEAHLGVGRVHVVRDRLEMHGEPGELVTLLPAHGPARGVTTGGLRFPLVGETLWPGSTRGVSNHFIGHEASVRIEEGALLAVLPGRGAAEPSHGRGVENERREDDPS
jgi:thiamine pyrophosphokinase